MEKLDNLHYSYREIDGYNKPFNFVLGPREPGKTSMAWLKKVYFPWRKTKRPWIYLTRTSVEISSALIESIADTIINKFTDDNVKLVYTKGTFKEGITDVFIGKDIFFRIVSLNIQLRRIKLAVLKNIEAVLMVEYVINPRNIEKYLKDEAYKIMEAYTTWRRECKGILKCYFLGNPYSLFNPLFVYWGVDTNKLKPGTFYVGENFVIHYCQLSEGLRAKLLEQNPLYKFDEDYSAYALDGVAMNDRNIKVVSKQPMGYSLRYVFRIANKFIGVYRNNYLIDHEDKYWCSPVDTPSARRQVWCFDFGELIERVSLISQEERIALSHFKSAMRRRNISFSSIEVYYYIEEIYNNL